MGASARRLHKAVSNLEKPGHEPKYAKEPGIT